MNSKLNSIVNKIIEYHLKNKRYKYSVQSPVIIDDGEVLNILPKELRDFYLICNGATFYNYRDLDGYEFYSIEDLSKIDRQIRDTYHEGYDKNKIVFCGILGEGNYIAIDSVGNIYDGFHEYDPISWPIIETSFTEWLEKLYENKGGKYWL